MLVNSASPSKLPIDNVAFCSHISSSNRNEFLAVGWLLVKGFNTVTENLARLYADLHFSFDLRHFLK